MRDEILKLYKKAVLLTPESPTEEIGPDGHPITYARMFGDYDRGLEIVKEERMHAIEQLVSMCEIIIKDASAEQLALIPETKPELDYEDALQWCSSVLRAFGIISDTQQVYFTPLLSHGSLIGFRKQKSLEGDNESEDNSQGN